MIASPRLRLQPCEDEIRSRADALILQFALSGGRDDLLSLARACEGFDDALSRAAGQAIGRRALNVPADADVEAAVGGRAPVPAPRQR